MSYRPDYHGGASEICGVPTDLHIHLLNGTSFEVIATCNYVQTDGSLEPIHLTAEGYGVPVVAFEPAVAGLTGTAWIDTVDDSKVHVVFTAECESAVSEDVECEFSVLAARADLETTTHIDCVVRGHLEIEDAPLPAVAPTPAA